MFKPVPPFLGVPRSTSFALRGPWMSPTKAGLPGWFCLAGNHGHVQVLEGLSKFRHNLFTHHEPMSEGWAYRVYLSKAKQGLGWPILELLPLAEARGLMC